jgi:hypothetical protein
MNFFSTRKLTGEETKEELKCTAGDFRRFPPQLRQTRNLETNPNARKARISGLFSHLFGIPHERRNGWLGGIEPPNGGIKIRQDPEQNQGLF